MYEHAQTLFKTLCARRLATMKLCRTMVIVTNLISLCLCVPLSLCPSFSFFLCMHVCMYVCIYVCMYVCMYVYMYVYICVCMYLSMYFYLAVYLYIYVNVKSPICLCFVSYQCKLSTIFLCFVSYQYKYL